MRPTSRVSDDGALPPGDVTVAVRYSTLNYKDGMVLKGLGRLVRTYPHVPGIDFAGTVERSESKDFKPGDGVILTGWRVGEQRWGGYAEKARVNAAELVPLPAGHEPEARHGDRHGRVHRDAGGVGARGSRACAGRRRGAGDRCRGRPRQRRRGAASPPRPSHRRGAPGGRKRTTICGVSAPARSSSVPNWPRRPSGRSRPSAGPAPSTPSAAPRSPIVLTQLRYGASVASCGLAGGSDLPATVVPFLLRGVNLLGINSVMCPMPRRRAAWARLARDLAPDALEAMTETVGLADLPALAERILAGGIRGRIVVDVTV